MSPALLSKPMVPAKQPVSKPNAVYSGTISNRGIATGIVTRMPAAADEVRLVVLNALGDVVSEQPKPVSEVGPIGLNFSDALLQKAGKEIYFLMVKGYVKGALAWEQRLGRFTFHS
jgi:hypothetical protein